MKVWRVAEGVLVPVDEGFVLFGPAGELVRRYTPRKDSFEDSLYTTTWVVEGDTLARLLTIETWREPERFDRRVELEGLTPIDEPRAAEWVQALFDQDARQAESQRERIEALAGPGPWLAERRLLAERVVRYGDRLARALLDRVDDEQLAGAARLIAFRPTEEDRAQPLFSGDPAVTGGRVPWLDQLVSDLVSEADLQERIDAVRTSAAYLQAATRLALAARER